MRTVRDPAWRARMGTIVGRKAEYEQWLLAGDMTGADLFGVAYRLPAWDRDHLDSPLPARRREAARHGWADWMNAAAIRELTQGEGGDPPAWQGYQAAMDRAIGGRCSHGGHDWDGDTCDEIPDPPEPQRCPWMFHGIDRAEHDGQVTLTLRGWSYTTNAERADGAGPVKRPEEVPCATRTVPARWENWGDHGERIQVYESDTAAEMVAAHVGEPYVPVWQGRGWTVEIRSGYPLWQVTA